MTKRFKPDKWRPLQRTFFKAWREFRHLSQEEVAERIGMTKTRVSLKERGLEPYDQHYLEALAVALGTRPAALLACDPKVEGDIYAMLDSLRPESRNQAVAMIRALKIADDHVQPDRPPVAPQQPHPRKGAGKANAAKVSNRETFN